MEVLCEKRTFMRNGLLTALGATILLLFVLSSLAGAGYDQEETDPEDDVIDVDTEEETALYPEIDIVSFVTTDNGDGTVDAVITYKGDIATSGKYVYYGNVSDGEDESRHYAEFYYVVEWGMNGINYQNGDEESEEDNVLVIEGKTITATIDLSKCGIPEDDFEITLGSTSKYSGSNWEDADYTDNVGEVQKMEGYKTTVEAVDNGGDEHKNDIKVTVLYEDGSRAEVPVEGAEVTVQLASMEDDEPRNGATDANGELVLENFVPGDYIVRVVDDQHADYNRTFYVEVLIDDTPILKVWADEHDMDGDEIDTDGEVYVYFGSMMEDLVVGAQVYMDDVYVGDTAEEAGHPGLEIEGPIAEGLHLIKAEFRGDVAYTRLHIETHMGDSFSEEMHISEVDEPGDPDDDLENDIYVEFTDDNSSDPIQGVDIYLDGGLMGTTDENGSVIRKDLTEGYHEVTATYDGDDYFWFLLIGFSEEHELGDFDFDGDKNDMKFTARVGGLFMPYSTFFLRNHTRNGMPETSGYTSFNGVGYVQDLEDGNYEAGIVNMMVGTVQLAEFNFSVGAGEETVTEPQEVDFGDGNEATVQAGVSGDVTLTSKAGSQPDSEDDDALGVYLEVTMDGTGDLNWVNITIDYDDVPEGIEPSKLKMYYWDDGNEEWFLIENSGVDTVNKFVWANVTHLTIFAARQEVGPDETPPTITHEAVLEATAGQKVTISAEVTDDGDGIQEVRLYYKKSTEGTYTDVEMVMSRASYSADIPAASVTTDDVDYYIWATDGTNEAFDPGVDMYHFIDISEGSGDTTPPTITHDPILTGYAGQPISEVFAEITDDVGVASAELYYRKSTDTEYTRYDMTIGEGGYYGKIPREFVTLDGVDYYIKASDGTNEVFDPGVDMWHYIEVTEATGNELPVGAFVQPLGGETFSGKIEINWTASDPDGDNLRFLLSISTDSGATWQGLYGSKGYYPTVETSYTFDTTNTSDGVDTPNGGTYRFMLELFDDGDPALSNATYTGDFTIYNEPAPANQAPIVEITSPTDGQTVSGVLSITWTATDPDGDNMMYTIKYSDDSGATWNDLKVNLHSLVQLKYDWDTNFPSTYPDGDTYRIKVIASDDNGTAIASGEDETGDFTINNAGGGGGDPGGDDPEEEDDEGIPGFELAVVVTAVVASAGFTSRRRKRR